MLLIMFLRDFSSENKLSFTTLLLFVLMLFGFGILLFFRTGGRDKDDVDNVSLTDGRDVVEFVFVGGRDKTGS